MATTESASESYVHRLDIPSKACFFVLCDLATFPVRERAYVWTYENMLRRVNAQKMTLITVQL